MQDSVHLHLKSIQWEPKERSREEPSSQLSSDLRSFHFISFIFSIMHLTIRKTNSIARQYYFIEPSLSSPYSPHQITNITLPVRAKSLACRRPKTLIRHGSSTIRQYSCRKIAIRVGGRCKTHYPPTLCAVKLGPPITHPRLLGRAHTHPLPMGMGG